jgi:hypothetical protein
MKLLVLPLEDYMLPCVNKIVFGIDCMGCGLQRSVVLIFKGEFISAFLMYPAIYFILLLLSVASINIVVKIKKFNKIITILAVLTVGSIITNFIIKTFIN